METPEPEALGPAPPQDNSPRQNERGDKRSKAEQKKASDLIKDLLASMRRNLWKDKDSRAYVSLSVRRKDLEVREHFVVGSDEFRRVLSYAFYSITKEYLSKSLLDQIAQVLEAVAVHEGRVKVPYVRFAYVKETIYLDLCNAAREVVEVDSNGYRILTSGSEPVQFLRPEGGRELPRPSEVEDGHALLFFRKAFNLTDEALALLLAFLVNAVNPVDKYTMLALQGAQGTGKSTLSRFVQQLLDPRSMPLSAFPRSEQDLVIAAQNRHLLAYDNLSGLTDSQADALCRLSTEGGLSARRLYSDSSEVRFHKRCPIIVNGIDDIATRNDLADRSLILHLAPVEPSERKATAEMDAAFEAALPAMLGALCLAWSTALRNRPTVTMAEAPRMADFALWVKAAEPALPIATGAFEQAYGDNIAFASKLNIDSEPLGMAVADFMGSRDRWEGSIKDLHEALMQHCPSRDLARMSLRGVGAALRRSGPALERLGISAVRDDRRQDPNTRRVPYTITRRVGR